MCRTGRKQESDQSWPTVINNWHYVHSFIFICKFITLSLTLTIYCTIVSQWVVFLFFFLLSHIKNISSHSTPGRSVIRRNPHLTATTLLMIDWKDIKRSRKVAEGQRSDGIILSSSAVPLDSVGHRRPGEWTFLITAVLTFPLSWLTFSQLVVSKTSSEVWY